MQLKGFNFLSIIAQYLESISAKFDLEEILPIRNSCSHLHNTPTKGIAVECAASDGQMLP
ncbi:hypothetical protein EYF80_009828 [Liparis tanakae]|uniref:Uncharacterized protein n=1 Tax=Liparis tanakae TaxID=230148 RepID=A0A4Z2IPP7_9TELE|nr:hypothetical protein EYF80_009828 [Liparis tanakae]